MPNPALNQSAFQKATASELEPGWASPHGAAPIAGPPPGAWTPSPLDVVSPWPPPGAPQFPDGYQSMRVGGVVSATAVLLALLVCAGWVGWQAVHVVTGTDAAGDTVVVSTSVPPWLFLSWIVGFGIAILTVVKPPLARITAPLYALAQGLMVGAISHLFEVQYDGIVLQAVGLTVGVFAIMLTLFALRIIRVTRRLMIGIISATGAVCLVYLATFVVRLFGGDIGFIHDAGPVGILFSLVVVGIAAANLLLDFNLVEQGVAMKAPRYMEWFAAFGLMVTLIWLYLELLRLLGKLRSR